MSIVGQAMEQSHGEAVEQLSNLYQRKLCHESDRNSDPEPEHSEWWWFLSAAVGELMNTVNLASLERNWN